MRPIFKEPAQTQMLNRLWELQKRNGYIQDNDIKQLALLFNLSEIEVEKDSRYIKKKVITEICTSPTILFCQQT